MGLDMYLTRKRSLGKAKVKISVLENEYSLYNNVGKEIEIRDCRYIEEEVGYWRKANQIHKWFVDNVQGGNDDCREYWVSTDKLKELLNICKEIKEKVIMKKGKVSNGQKMTEDGWVDILEDGEYISNPEICEELLPVESGFFFGSTAYDQWYMENIDNTIKIIEKILKEEEKIKEEHIWCDYYYQSSW